MAEETELRPLAEAESPEEFKKLRTAHREAARAGGADAQPKEPKESGEPKGSEPPASEAEPKSETAAASEAAPESQEKKPKRDNSETRIKELLRDREEQAREIAELKKRLEPRPAAAEAPKQEPEPKSDAAPKLKDYLSGPKAKDGESYDEAHERWALDLLDHREKERDKREADRKRSESVTERVNRQAAESKKRHADFDQVVTADAAKRVVTTLAQPAVLAMRDESDNGTDVLYELISKPEELARISALLPLRQAHAILSLSERLANPEPTPESKPQPVLRPAVSKAPPPARTLSGVDPGPDPKLSDAKNFEEFKTIRHRKAG